MTDVTDGTLFKDRSLIPELPAGRFRDGEDTKCVTGIHESRIVRVMRAAHDFHTGIFQQSCVSPLHIVRHRITHNRALLMAVGAYQWFFVTLAIEEKPLGSHKPNRTDTYSLAIAIHYPTLVVTHTHLKGI